MRLRPEVYFYEAANGLDFSKEINCNSVLVAGERHLLIDPGTIRRWDDLLAAIRADGLDPRDIGLVFLTHSHPDHAEAAIRAKAELGAEVALGFRECDFLGGTGRVFYRKEFYEREASGARYQVNEYLLPDRSMMTPVFPGPFQYMGRVFRLHDCPGHSPGGLGLHWPEAGLLATGDAYFPGTIGAFDLPGGSFPAMVKSLKILCGLRDVDLVACGHGAPIVGRPAVEANHAALAEEVGEKMARRGEAGEANDEAGADPGRGR
jgi:glyoxylase-like metal-dependent hydrolase (beta-lactamase superfamily II)